METGTGTGAGAGAGKGELSPFFKHSIQDKKYFDKWESYVAKGYGPTADFALLREITDKKTPCVQVSREEVLRNEKLHTLSSTCMKNYQYDSERNGLHVFYSEGMEVTEELSSITNLKNNIMFFSTVSGENCSSGSLVMGEENKAKGILVQANYYSTDKESPSKRTHFTTSIKMSYALQVLENHWRINPFQCDP